MKSDVCANLHSSQAPIGGSNPGPYVYETHAPPTELYRQLTPKRPNHHTCNAGYSRPSSYTTCNCTTASVRRLSESVQNAILESSYNQIFNHLYVQALRHCYRSIFIIRKICQRLMRLYLDFWNRAIPQPEYIHSCIDSALSEKL